MYYTADLCDTYLDRLALCTTPLRSFGGRTLFHGPITTVRVFEDNVKLRDAIEEADPGAVIVVDGGGSMRCALFGGNMAARAVERGIAGLIIFGAVRDTQELAQLDLGVLALGSCPKRSQKAGPGDRNVEILFGDISWKPGHYVYADGDGVVLSPDLLDLPTA